MNFWLRCFRIIQKLGLKKPQQSKDIEQKLDQQWFTYQDTLLYNDDGSFDKKVHEKKWGMMPHEYGVINLNDGGDIIYCKYHSDFIIKVV